MRSPLRARRAAPLIALIALVAPVPSASETGAVPVQAGPLTATVTLDPFGIVFSYEGSEVLGTAPRALDPTDPTGRYGPLGFAVGGAAEVHQLGYHLGARAPVRWFHATTASSLGGGIFDVATDDPAGRRFRLTVAARHDGVIEVGATLNDTTGVSLAGAGFRRGAGERFLGLGERSDGADQTGNTVVSWNEEGPWSAGALSPATDPVLGPRWQGPEPLPGTNFSMPWFLSSRGYGFLLDSTWLNEFRLASDRPDAWSVATREPALRYRVYGGPKPAGALARFTADSGRQPEPAKWFFGPWDQTGGGKDPLYWRANDVPVTVAQNWTPYFACEGNPGSSPGARRALTDYYHSAGFKATAYVNTFVCSGNSGGVYQEGDAAGYFLRTQRGETYPIANASFTYAPPVYGVVDVTNPAAAKWWWHGLVDDALADGWDGWMEDFGEYVPVDSVAFDGRAGLALHNDYCTAYHKFSHEETWPLRGSDFAQFVRCGYTGTAPYARIVWNADPAEDWSASDGLKAAVEQGLSMGLSGIAYWGSDIGGFHAATQARHTDAELLIRWLEFGTFSGVMRVQIGWSRPAVAGQSTYSNERAQVWDPDVQPTWRKLSKLRTQLFPYLWAAAQEYQATGMPMIRHLGLAFPDDPNVYSPQAEHEFMFGPDLLVAPVVEQGASTRTLYLPPGEWVNFWNAVRYEPETGSFVPRAGATVEEGGKLVTVDAPLDEIPTFVRAGTCLTLLPPDTDTLAEVGTMAGLVHLSDTAGRWRALGFAADCPDPNP